MLVREHSVWCAPGFGAWMQAALSPDAGLAEFGPDAIFLLLDSSFSPVDRDGAECAVSALEAAFPRAVVSVPEGLVGRVVSVTPHTCEILLVTDPSLKVACEVALPGGDFLRGTLAGGSDERLALRHILSKAEVPPRSPVFTSGLGGVFPKGIAVGTLLEVRQDRDSPRREGEVLPAVDFSTLKDVFIRRER